MDLNANLQSPIQGDCHLNEPLGKYTSWWIGGPAKCVFIPHHLTDLAQFLKNLPEDEPLLWLGLGSNTLIRDGGFPGTVIITQGGLNQIEVLPNQQVRVEAGVACPKLAKFLCKHNLVGMEFWSGIPGTAGGAFAMNAGAFGHETWSRVTAVETIDKSGNIHHRQAEEFQAHYREVTGPANEWFVAGILQLSQGDGQQSALEIKQYLKKRSDTQPIGLRNCGSVFRNPEGDYAARLIEQVGLKGYRIGDAIVSEKHANFIINHGQASAKAVEQLIKHVENTVLEETGIQLKREVKIIGLE